MAENYPNRWKTPREKEKLLIMRNFSFSHSVFKRLALQTRKNQGFFGKGLNTCQVNALPSLKISDRSIPKALVDLADKINVTEKLKIISGKIENIVCKGENAGNQHFLIFPQCFFLRVVKRQESVLKD